MEKWLSKIEEANKAYQAWESKYKCKELYRFYQGRQNSNDDINMNSNYVYNLFASTIDISTAGLQFSSPKFKVNAAPGTSGYDFNIDLATKSAQLKEDVVNTIITNKKLNFAGQIKLALLDSAFRFGVIEVGYADDFRNPIGDFPVFAEGQDGEEKPKLKRKRKPLGARDKFFVKRIPARRFRVSQSDAHFLEDQEWVGYYSWEYVNTLKAMKEIDFPKNFSGEVSMSGLIGGSDNTQSPLSDHSASVKVWHIWDQVEGKRCLRLDGQEGELWEEDFETLPLSTLRWRLLLDAEDDSNDQISWYPKPLTYDWLPIQKEINECREQERSLRRRFIQRFQATKGQISPEQIREFQAGAELIISDSPDAVRPIANATTSAAGWENLKVTENEFNIISGTSAAARGAADRETATQAKLIAAQSQVRENFNQIEYGNFVAMIGDNLLKVAESHMEEGLWVKLTVPQNEEMLAMVQQEESVYKFVQQNAVADGFDYEVSISVENATPASIQADQQAFLSFVSLVSQNPFLAANPVLIREAAVRLGYRNEKVVGQMQQAALMAIMAKTQQGAQEQGVNSDNLQKQQLAQQGTPSNMQADHQMQQQAKPQ